MLVLTVMIMLCAAVGAFSEVPIDSCPIVDPKELDIKELDGKWYIAAAATELAVTGDCAMVLFSHKTDNTTDISISWIKNSTFSFYNGSVELTPDPNSNSTDGDLLRVTYTDGEIKSYSFLVVDYEHYAVLLSCNHTEGYNTTYEILELTRSPHAKPKHASKISQLLTKYGLNGTEFLNFNNTQELCRTNGGDFIKASALAMLTTAALFLFRN